MKNNEDFILYQIFNFLKYIISIQYVKPETTFKSFLHQNLQCYKTIIKPIYFWSYWNNRIFLNGSRVCQKKKDSNQYCLVFRKFKRDAFSYFFCLYWSFFWHPLFSYVFNLLYNREIVFIKENSYSTLSWYLSVDRISKLGLQIYSSNKRNDRDK